MNAFEVGDFVVVKEKEYSDYTPGSNYNLPRTPGVVVKSGRGFIEVSWGSQMSPPVNPDCFNLAFPKILIDVKKEGTSTGGATAYYDFPEGFKTLNDLIEYKDMPFWRGNIMKATFRLGEKDVATEEYDLNKIIYFANRRLDMLKRERENG